MILLQKAEFISIGRNNNMKLNSHQGSLDCNDYHEYVLVLTNTEKSKWICSLCL